MSSHHAMQSSESKRNLRFATTRWSVVVRAGRRGSADAERALATLCETYWYPVYALVRRQGHSLHDAQDLTQDFFARLLEKNDLAAADRGRGRFRSFLLAAVKHFLSNRRDLARAKKRGGDLRILSLNLDAGEERLAREPSHEATPEKLFERRWAVTLLEVVLARLRDEFKAAGKQTLFDRLKGTLAGEKAEHRYAELADEFGTTAGAIKVAAHRLRKRYRELLREEIAQTVAEPAEVEAEIRELFAALDT